MSARLEGELVAYGAVMERQHARIASLEVQLAAITTEPEPAASVPVPTPEVEEIRKRHSLGDKLLREGVHAGTDALTAYHVAHQDRATLLALLARSQDGRG